MSDDDLIRRGSAVEEVGDLPSFNSPVWSHAKLAAQKVIRALPAAEPSPLAAAARELARACETLLEWHHAEDNAIPYTEDGGESYDQRLLLCGRSKDLATSALAAYRAVAEETP